MACAFRTFNAVTGGNPGERMKKALLVLITAAAFLAACRRDQGDSLPTAELQSPADGTQYNVYDTIHVYVKASDNDGLASLRLRITDANQIPVLPVIDRSLTGTSYEATYDIPIDDIRILSGYYYVYADIADVDGNRRSVYRMIGISEIPRMLKGFFTATQPLSSLVSVYRTDTSWTASPWNQYASDFTDMAVSAYWQQVYISGSYTGPLRAESIDGVYAGWSQSAFASALPYWGPLSVYDKRLLVSIPGQSQLRSLDQAGNMSFFAMADNNFYPDNQLQYGNRIFIEEKEISTTNERMVVFSSSGGAIQETVMPVDAVGMFAKDQDLVYVTGNTAGQGHIYLYSFTGNNFYEPVSLPSGLVTAATQIDSNTVLIAMDNGNLYRFTYNPVGLLSWASGLNAVQLRYDAVNDQVYAAEGNNVNVYDYNPFTLQRTVVFPEPVKDVELWYNR